MKTVRFTRTSAIMLLAITVLSACGINEKEPFNSISDRLGLSIDLAWTTHSGVPAALVEADLDLDILKGEGEILSSYNSNEFEHVDLKGLADGEYTVKVTLSEISKRSDYTLRVKSASEDKVFKVSGHFNGNEGETSVSMLKIIKEGQQFTLTTL